MFQNYFLTAVRNILRYRYFSAIIIAGLTLGIAVFLLVLTYVRNELSFDRFNEHFESIYRLEMPDWALTGTAYGPELSDEFPEIATGARVSSWEGGNVTIRIEDRMMNLNNLIYADSSFLDIFTLHFISGDPENCLNTPNSVILTKSTAKKLFGNEDPVNRTFLLNNKVMLTVTGVIEDVSRFHLKINAIAPFRTLKLFYENPEFLNQYGSWNYYTYFKLGGNTDPSPLVTKINKFYTGRIFWEDNPPEFSLRPLREIYYTHVKNDFPLTKANKPMLRIYLLVAVFILIIACVNFINLAIAKATTRSKEIGVRKVTGATRHNLIIQFLGETVIYTLVATVLALIVMEILRPVFIGLVQRELSLLSIGWIGLIALLLILPLVIGIVAGLYPAYYLTRFNAIVTMKGVKTRGRESLLFRRILIILQFTISVMLIIAAFTVYKQLNYFRNTEIGYNKENIIQLHMNASLNEHRDVFREKLLSNSSIKGVSLSTQSLENVSWQESLEVQAENKPYTYLGTDTEFLPMMGIEMAEGRSFRRDMPSDSGKVIINEKAVAYFGLEKPIIGKFIGTGDRRFEVLGVTRDFHYHSLHSPIGPLIIGLRKDWLSTVTIRFENRNLQDVLAHLESVWNELSPDFLFDYRFLDDSYQKLYSDEKRLGTTFIYLAFLAILIACIGLLGLSAFITERRMKEIGIRKTMGDTTSGLVIKFSREFGSLVFISGLLAIPLSYMLMNKWLGTFAYHAKIDAFLLIAACFIALLVALGTVYFQIKRIANSNPVEALRYE
jgi:putative ABC transport system permease protein